MTKTKQLTINETLDKMTSLLEKVSLPSKSMTIDVDKLPENKVDKNGNEIKVSMKQKVKDEMKNHFQAEKNEELICNAIDDLSLVSFNRFKYRFGLTFNNVLTSTFEKNGKAFSIPEKISGKKQEIESTTIVSRIVCTFDNNSTNSADALLAKMFPAPSAEQKELLDKLLETSK